MKASQIFKTSKIVRDFTIEIFTMPDTNHRNSIVFVEKASLIDLVNKNENISGVIVLEKLWNKIDPKKGIVIEKNPKNVFYDKYVEDLTNWKPEPNKIHSTASISPNALLDNHGIVIGKGTIIEDRAIIKSGTMIGDYCRIASGAVIGGDGFEIKDLNGKKSVLPHNGIVKIFNNVYVGHNTCIDKGIFGEDTLIEDNTKIDNLVNIAHCVKIGKNCLITAGVTFSGSVKVGDSVFFGPNSTITNGVKISDGAQVSIGSTVVSNVSKNTKVSGYFAIDHAKFLKERIQKMKKN